MFSPPLLTVALGTIPGHGGACLIRVQSLRCRQLSCSFISEGPWALGVQACQRVGAREVMGNDEGWSHPGSHLHDLI